MIALPAIGPARADAEAEKTQHFTFDIDPQPLDSALIALSVTANINILGKTQHLQELSSPRLEGVMTLEQALVRMLSGTGLSYKRVDGHSVLIFSTLVRAAPDKPETTKEPLEEIYVVATRRSSNLQTTPLAVTSLNQQTLAQNQVRDLRDIANLVPGLEFVNTSPQAAVLVQLRGVGTTNITEIADGPVAIHVDGVYSPRSQSVAALLHDVERVEVLRGPQGTLFGRNSSSGSINIYNIQPKLDSRSASVYANYGNFNQTALRTVVNTPLSDSLAVRFAGSLNRHDAYTGLLDNYAGLGVHYPAADEPLSDFDRALDLGQQGPETVDQLSLRLSALWQPSERFELSASLETYRDNGTGIAELDPTLVQQGIRAVVLDSPTFLDLENNSLRTKLQYRFANGWRLEYNLGLADMRRSQIVDIDNGRDGAFEQQRTDSSRFRFYSHELQLFSSDTKPFRWLTGIYTSGERNRIVFAVDQQNASPLRGPQGASSWISDTPGAAVFYAIQPDRRVDSLGLYSQGSYQFADYQRLTLGVRYTRDTKSDRGGRAINCNVTSVLGPYVEPGSVATSGPLADQLFADADTQNAIDAGLPHDLGTDAGIGSQPCWVRQVNDFSATWSNVSGLLRYDMELREGSLLYASVSTGFKSGHIQDSGNNASPETVLNYELGLKTELFDHSLRINTALYLAEYDDLQFSNQDRLDTNGDGIVDTGSSTVVRNASAATIKGLEVEAQWALTRFDQIQLTATLTSARFERFEIPDTLFGNLFNPFVSELSNDVLDPVDLSGNRPPRTPGWKFRLAYERLFRTAFGDFNASVKGVFSDDYFLDIYNRDQLQAGVFDILPSGGSGLGIQKAYATFDLNLHYRPRNANWDAQLYVKNLTDEAVKLSSGNFITENGFVATYQPPRTVGVEITSSF
ncbi:TonB-dependent receptor domain-containing protein [Porticoccus sp. GXU_MW_L64]